LIDDEDVRAGLGEEDGKAEVEGANDGASDLPSTEDGRRQPIAVDGDVELATGLFEGVGGVVVGGVDVDGVGVRGEGLEADGGVDNEALSTADAEVRVDEVDEKGGGKVGLRGGRWRGGGEEARDGRGGRWGRGGDDGRLGHFVVECRGGVRHLLPCGPSLQWRWSDAEVEM
jgi:hypothetical protein